MPLYFDPNDPEPEPINADEYDDRVLYVRETPEETAAAARRRELMYAPKDPDDDPNEPHIVDMGKDEEPMYMNEERQVENADWVCENMPEKDPDEFHREFHGVTSDVKGLSTIAQAILDVLEPHEEEWDILSRHELILTSPNPDPDAIETQKQFDAYRDHHVAVETYDPFGSNRTLKGQLVDRNAMDLLLNIKGRLVTVPLNFVKCVRLPPQGNEYQAEEEDEEEAEDDDEEVEDDDESEEDDELEEAIPNGDSRLMP